MNSQDIKDIQRKLTRISSENWDPRASIGASSQAYESTGASEICLLPRGQRGLWAEAHVCKHYEGEGYRIVFHRLKLKTGEWDLGFLSSQGQLVLVEVKLVTSPAFVEHAIQKRQIVRLQRSAEFLRCLLKLPTLVHFAAVTLRGEIIILKSGVFDGGAGLKMYNFGRVVARRVQC